jgi:hypothetical protein
MNRMLCVLCAVTGVSGAVILILSVFLNSGKLLNVGLIALLIAALFMIATVLIGHLGHRGHT